MSTGSDDKNEPLSKVRIAYLLSLMTIIGAFAFLFFKIGTAGSNAPVSDILPYFMGGLVVIFVSAMLIGFIISCDQCGTTISDLSRKNQSGPLTVNYSVDAGDSLLQMFSKKCRACGRERL